MRRRQALFAGALIALAILWPAQASLAHGGAPAKTSPSADSQVAELPKEVKVEFEEDLKELPVGLSVLGPEGQQVLSGSAAVESGAIVGQLDPAKATAGVYTVTYQGVFEDGAATKGNFTFTLTAAPEAAASAEAVSAQGTAEGAVSTSNAIPGWVWASALGGIALIVGGVIAGLASRRLN